MRRYLWGLAFWAVAIPWLAAIAVRRAWRRR